MFKILFSICSSLYWDSFEHANATNTSAMAFNFVNKNPHKETEYKDNIKDNDYSIVPKLKSNFHDVFAELEKEMAEDPRKIAFAEAADNPVLISDVVKGEENPLEEVVPNIVYGQGHNIRKYPGHLAPNQQDNFENPYARKQPTYPQMPPVPVPYPSYPQGYPQYPMQQNYGRRRRRKKRETVKKPADDYDAHWGIHRIMSTGIEIDK